MTSTFCGKSGLAYTFQRVGLDTEWAARKGIALFAAPDAFGWRVMSIQPLDGRRDNIRPIWALREAQRYGARAVFFLEELDHAARDAMVRDLSAGFDPVCGDGHMALAA